MKKGKDKLTIEKLHEAYKIIRRSGYISEDAFLEPYGLIIVRGELTKAGEVWLKEAFEKYDYDQD